MRIRNKLVTVQLIITLTLILSVVIFSNLMVTVNSVKDSQIKINRINSQIYNLNSVQKIFMSKRNNLRDLTHELDHTVKELNENILSLEKISILNSTKFKDGYISLRQDWITIDARSAYRVSQYITTEFTPMESRFVQWYGIKNSLQQMEKWFTSSQEKRDEYSSILAKYTQLQQYHSDLKSDTQKFISNWESLYKRYNTTLSQIQNRSLIRAIVYLIILLFVSIIASFRITNKIPKNLDSVNRSLLRMTQGDFSTNLNIEAGDEFGDLSRNFNTFVEQLWKKLDSMNVIMKDIGHAMGENIELNKIQSNIINNITNHIIADSAGILTLENNELHLTASKGHFPPFYPIEEDITQDRPKAARYLSDHPTPLDIPIIRECLTTRKPILIKDCSEDPAFPQCRDEKSSLFIRSFLMVPLINAGENIGVFVLLRTHHQTPFSDLDYSNFFSFSDYAALTMDTINKYNELLEKFEIQKEIGVAADIQTSLTPKKMPDIKGLSSAAYTLAAKGVSGDYYDFFRMNRTTVGATVCDVAGKGVPASLVMVMIRTILRLVASPKRGAAETLTLLNKSISGKIDIDRYATMGFFKIDLETRKLSFSNAAHHPIQIFRQSTRKFYAIDSPGLPVGIDRDSTFSEKRISLEPGDIIFMYTDGFPEARNPEGDEYSTNRMLREIRLNCHKNAQEILNSVVTDMQVFTKRAKQHDDQTLLIVKLDEER